MQQQQHIQVQIGEPQFLVVSARLSVIVPHHFFCFLSYFEIRDDVNVVCVPLLKQIKHYAKSAFKIIFR